MSNNYGNESISRLSDREAVRLRPANILGSDDIAGSTHVLYELAGNSLDEAKAQYGDTVIITKYKDLSLSVEDFGRGAPLSWNESEKEWNYYLIYSVLHSGGKYSKGEDQAYEYAIGLSGLGAAASQLSSEHFYVRSRRDGYCYEIESRDGEFIGELKETKEEYDSTGTFVKWKSSLDVFTDIDVNIDVIKTFAKEQAIVNKGIKLIVVDEIKNETTEYFYENGITDYMKEYVEDTAFSELQYWESEAQGKDADNRKEYKSKYQVVFCFTNDKPMLNSYHNSSYLKDGGSPHDGIKSAFTYVIDNLIKNANKYDKKEKKISFQDIEPSLAIISNTYSTETSYQNQTKFKINNKFIRQHVDQWIKEQLEVYFIENPLTATKVVEQTLINKRSKEAAERTRLNVKKKLQGSVNTLTGRIEGFANCLSKDNTKNEIILVEGRSALGSAKQGRDAEIQAIYALRGKILNCLKADYDKIFKNEIIVDLLKILGCGIEVKSKHNKDLNAFDINNLRWSKVCILVDGDIDGHHVATLLLTMLYRLTPSLINEGKVYMIESPLFEIIDQNDESHFAYNDKERDEIVSSLKGKCLVQRSKGLGENTPEMMWDSTLNPETRRFMKITPDTIEEMKKYFDLFLGDDLAGRKDYIQNHLHEYIEEELN